MTVTYVFHEYDSDGQPAYRNTTTGEVVKFEYLLSLGATLPLGDTVVVEE